MNNYSLLLHSQATDPGNGNDTKKNKIFWKRKDFCLGFVDAKSYNNLNDRNEVDYLNIGRIKYNYFYLILKIKPR